MAALSFFARIDPALNFDVDVPTCSNLVSDDGATPKIYVAVAAQKSSASGAASNQRIYLVDINTSSAAVNVSSRVTLDWENSYYPSPGIGHHKPVLAKTFGKFGVNEWYIGWNEGNSAESVWWDGSREEGCTIFKANAGVSSFTPFFSMGVGFKIVGMYGKGSKLFVALKRPRGPTLTINNKVHERPPEMQFYIFSTDGSAPGQNMVSGTQYIMSDTDYLVLGSRPQQCFWYDGGTMAVMIGTRRRSSTGLVDQVVAVQFDPTQVEATWNETVLETLDSTLVTSSTPLYASPRLCMGQDGVLRATWNTRVLVSGAIKKTLGMAVSPDMGRTWGVFAESAAFRGNDSASHAMVWNESDVNSLCLDAAGIAWMDMLGDETQYGESFKSISDTASGVSYVERFAPNDGVAMAHLGVSGWPGASVFVGRDRYRTVGTWKSASSRAELWLCKSANAGSGTAGGSGSGGLSTKFPE